MTISVEDSIDKEDKDLKNYEINDLSDLILIITRMDNHISVDTRFTELKTPKMLRMNKWK
jgi:hypothetical protein